MTFSTECSKLYIGKLSPLQACPVLTHKRTLTTYLAVMKQKPRAQSCWRPPKLAAGSRWTTRAMATARCGTTTECYCYSWTSSKFSRSSARSRTAPGTGKHQVRSLGRATLEYPQIAVGTGLETRDFLQTHLYMHHLPFRCARGGH